jgi:hypothetical protein
MRHSTRWSLALGMMLSASGIAAALPARVAQGSPEAAIVAVKGCKYKTDGTGNCLSPAFFKCQKEWTKCSEACKGDLKCLDKCEVKFAPQCGD